MGSSPSKPTTAEDWSKRAGGADKKQRSAEDWANTPVCPCAGLERVFEAAADCEVYTAYSAFPVVSGVMELPCTMTVYRAMNGELSIFNAFRVPPDVEDVILALGPVRHIVALGAFHGASDAYYLRCPKFEAPLHWALANSRVANGLPPPHELTETECPVAGGCVISLASPFPEAALILPMARDSTQNILVTADALTHTFCTAGTPIIGRLLLNHMGLAEKGVPAPAPLWLKHQKDAVDIQELRQYYSEILKQPRWSGIVTGHGPALEKCDHDEVFEIVEKALSK